MDPDRGDRADAEGGQPGPGVRSHREVVEVADDDPAERCDGLEQRRPDPGQLGGTEGDLWVESVRRLQLGHVAGQIDDQPGAGRGRRAQDVDRGLGDLARLRAAPVAVARLPSAASSRSSR